MSLINQALRKAQRDRTPARATGSDSSGPVQPNTQREKGMNPGLIAGLVLAIAVLTGLVAGLSVVLLKSPRPDNAPPLEGIPEKMQTAGAEAVRPEAENSSRIEPMVFPSGPSPDAKSQNGMRSSTLVDELRAAREAAEAELAVEAKEAAEAERRAIAEPSKEAIEWLSRAQLTGVKISPTGGKVILNGESYAVGEYVNSGLGLKVMVVQEERVLFVDENGKKYMKRL